MHMNARRVLSQATLVVVALIFSIGIQAFAFTQPPSSPPNSDRYAPLNASSTAQATGGLLELNTGDANHTPEKGVCR